MVHQGILFDKFEKDSVVIPPELANRFDPALLCLFEWHEYFLELPEVDCLKISDTWLPPLPNTHTFRIVFQNQLGLANIQPFYQGQPVDRALTVEIISSKFPTPGHHLAFFQSLLDDLFLRAARIPFSISSPTSRGVVEALRPPTPLFVYHFLKQFSISILEAVNVILANPFRLLSIQPDRVPIFQAKQAGPDVLLDILHSSSPWVKTGAIPLAKRLNGSVPIEIEQRSPQEVYDNPENRFILQFIKTLLTTSESLPSQNWWSNVPIEISGKIYTFISTLRQVIHHPIFEEVSEMVHLPFNSQVLLRRDGYRELFDHWRLYQQARRPVFEPLQRAIDVRDIAKLYEYWVFFALVEEIEKILGVTPVIDLNLSDEHGLNWDSRANFSKHGRLIFNQTFSRSHYSYHSYSMSMRPDFVWVQEGEPRIIFDAKFRLDLGVSDEDDVFEFQASPVVDDLYKMHTYRDALGIPIVLTIFPGTRSIFYDIEHGRLESVPITEILAGKLSGVGAIPLSPLQDVKEINHTGADYGN